MTAPVALITGGARGIGAAIVRELARREHDICFVYKASEQAALALAESLCAAGRRCLAIRADLRVSAEIDAAVKQCENEFGRIDVLVNNAGITQDSLLAASTAADFSEVMALNFLAAVHCTRLVSRMMIAQRRGSIVNLSSVAAQVPGRGQSNYAASKGAIESFTRAMAVELAPRTIRVNAVAPGIIETDMTEELRAIAPEELRRRVLLRRFGEVDEVARVVGFLACEASYVTGQIWHVDGGFKLE